MLDVIGVRCVRSRCVGVSRSRSTTSSSGPSGAPLSTNTAVPPGASPRTYAFESQLSCIDLPTIILHPTRAAAGKVRLRR